MLGIDGGRMVEMTGDGPWETAARLGVRTMLWLQSLGAQRTCCFISHLAEACLQGCLDGVMNLITVLITALPILTSEMRVVLPIMEALFPTVGLV